MSKSFTRLFLTWTKNILLNDTRYQSNNEINIKISASLFTIGAFTHGIYTLGTAKTEKSKIIKNIKWCEMDLQNLWLLMIKENIITSIIVFGIGNGIQLKIGVI